MRRLSIILAVLVLLWPGHLPADGVMINSYQYVTSGTGLCSSCTPGDPSDVFCEDFEGPRCSWTETGEGSGDVNPQSTRNQSTMPCTSKGTYNADFNITSASDEAYYQRAKSDTTSTFVQFYVYIESEGLADNDAITFLQLENSSGEMAGAVGIRQSGGSVYLATYTNNWGTGPGTGSTALSTGTWYRVGVQHTKSTSPNGIRVYLNGTEQTGCRLATAAQATENVAFGGGYKPARYQIDNIQIDDDTMPEACAE